MMKKSVRGKFPDDKRDQVLTKGRIVKMEPIKPLPKVWQLELYKSNDPRKMEHDCSTNFFGVYLEKGWGPPFRDLGPMSPRNNVLWDARINVTNEERKNT
jgi:hypothetical protein